jgi:hypothetical protein
VCIFKQILKEGEKLMKNILFWLLLLCSFATFACDEDPQGVGGATTDGASAPRMLSSAHSNEQIECIDLPNIKVTGFVYFGIQRLVIGITYALNGNGGGGGGSSDSVEIEQNLSCESSSEDRFDAATIVFKAAMLKAMKPGGVGRFAFCREYPAGSTFTFEFPNGQSSDFSVFSCTASFRPLSAEIPGTCG